MQKALFESGHEVGRMATKCYPNGILIREDHLHHEDAVRSTIDAMNDPEVQAIFEAAYTEGGVRVRADILERVPAGGWNLIEVKASSGVKEEYSTDLAVQYHILQMAEIDLDRVYLMHINRDYVFDGMELELDGFFVLEDMTDDAAGLQDFVRENISQIKKMLSMDRPPVIQPSRRCHQPHKCEFWGHCTRNVPENWILQLSGIRQEHFEDLTARGVFTIDNIPNFFPLTAIQRRIRDCIIESREHIDPALHDALNDVSFLVHFLDFETVSPAIPRYAGTRPSYQILPFQWSDHILYSNGTIEHKEFLCDEDIDPRTDFMQSLLDVLKGKGTIFIYTTYEQRILRDLAGHSPEHADHLNRLHSRFVDLYALIKAYYYNPAFNGSFSLKNVLPALVPEMDYQNLAIREGGTASLEYIRMLDPQTPVTEKRKIRKNLLAYCEQDTLAIVKIRDALLSE